MNLLHNFLGVSRWNALGRALRGASADLRTPEIGVGVLLLTLLLALTPVVLTCVQASIPGLQTTIPTLGFGICALLAMLLRWRFNLRIPKRLPWPQALSLTHTAIALGCIPAVAVLFVAPELLAERHDVVTQAVQNKSQPGTPRLSLPEAIALIAMMAAWVAVTEEIIFRGLLVSSIRRCRFIRSQRARDVTAVLLSATLFGAAHYATWGLMASIALAGLGVGFVIAYIATDEDLLPVIAYHFAFDFLSISVSVFA